MNLFLTFFKGVVFWSAVCITTKLRADRSIVRGCSRLLATFQDSQDQIGLPYGWSGERTMDWSLDLGCRQCLHLFPVEDGRSCPLRQLRLHHG
mmetsp:Transcript_26616/g.43074  ORF Transcript_26616/g.43074 Transcript_26616/m.43074 type:complete len:93 (+) Transcript_26616:124-402(+)